MIIAFQIKKLIASLLLLGMNATVMAEVTPDPLPALEAARWHVATHAILLEARDDIRNEPFLPKQLALDGFTSDAINSARMLCRACQPAALVDVVSASTAMSVDEKERVLNEALANLRGGSQQPVFRSGTFTAIALLYSMWGFGAQAHSVFDEAIASAVTDPASGPGFHYIAFELAKAAPESVPDWMILSLVKAIGRWPPSDDAALAYLDLARIRFKQRQPEAEIDLMERALDACAVIASYGQAQGIRSMVGRLALDSNQVEFARQRIPALLITDANALFEARSGHEDTALYYLAKLQGPTLYVDHRGETLRSIIREASNRGDFSTAKFFVDQVDPQMTGMRIELWTIIARAEWLNGDSKASQLDFRRALSIVEAIPFEQRHSSIDQEGVLAEAMANAELHEESLRLSHSIKVSLMALPERQNDTRIVGLLLLAAAFRAASDAIEAKQTLILAYQTAHDYQSPNQYGTKKSQLLMRVASVTEAFR
ncbi:hypothetical protein ABH944_004087 [Caballeronia udeis]|uniref:Tetratricopeptide repeat protein n=1 Tax=Caballeronia udeis TaxID=1232866 RepID=A0ABW8MLH0_9BURK